MTPDEIRAKALDCALTVFGHRPVVDREEVLRWADRFVEYITGPPTEQVDHNPYPAAPTRRIVVPEQRADAPGEHLDHDGELLSALCAGCAHSRGVHKLGGCHVVTKAGPGEAAEYCTCERFTEVRPTQKIRIVPECRLCGKPWSDVHGQPGDPCAYAGGPA